MRIKAKWRGGFGFAQIMALLLVVLPTVVFIITLLLEYWAVMRIDNNLKLMTHLATSKLNNVTDLSLDVEDAQLQSALSRYCPKETSVSLAGSRVADGAGADFISVSASYTYSGNYLKNKTITAKMETYSYHDQNGTIELVCN